MLMTAEYEKYLIPVKGGFMIDPKAPEEVKQELISINKEYEIIYGEKLLIEKDNREG
ncbi:MAG TPA: hypothetical protein GX693_00860 [Firmicutes bacterium]|nr:hypothetical protein [Bacillota bacterium]